jgi:hypothetical protein
MRLKSVRSFWRVPIFAAVMLCFLHAAPSVAQGQSLPTPDNWKQHVTPGGFAGAYQRGSALGGVADVNLTTRYRLIWNDFSSDQNLYQYLRVNLSEVSLGKGTVSAHLFARAAGDIDGDRDQQGNDSQYYIFRDALDAEDEDVRIYTGNIVLNKVLPKTDLTLGRTHASHLDVFQIDGADATVALTDRISAYAFGGAPVSYFFDSGSDRLFGGGVSAKLFNKTVLRLEYQSIDVDDEDDQIVAVRLDQAISLGGFYGEYRNIDSSNLVEVGGNLKLAATKTVVSFTYRQLFDQVEGDDAFGFPVNPLTISLLPYAEHQLYSLRVDQQILPNVHGRAEVELKNADDDQFVFDNRDYVRYRLAFDFDGIPTSETFFSLFGEYWDVDSVVGGNDNGRLQLGARVSHSFTEQIDVWAGTGYEQFKFDFDINERKESVRTLYVGGQWTPAENIALLVDLTAENSDVFDDLNTSEFEKNYIAEMWLNLVF